MVNMNMYGKSELSENPIEVEMKELLLTTTLVALLSECPAMASESRSFDGPYVGLQLSRSQIQDEHTDKSFWYYGVKDFGMKDSGPAIGVRAGWDFEHGRLISGIQVEANLQDLDTYRKANPYTPSYKIGASVSKTGSVRAKIGIREGSAIASFNAGAALANLGHRYDEDDGSTEHYRYKKSQVGWVYGAELAFVMKGGSFFSIGYSQYRFKAREHTLMNAAEAPVIATWNNGEVVRWRQRTSVQTLTASYNIRL